MPSSSDSYGASFAERQATIALRERLVAYVQKPLELRFNTNRRTFFSCRTAPNTPPRISLHRCFLEAPDEVLQAVGTLITKSDARALAICRDFVNRYDLRHKRQGRSQPLPPALRRTQGQWHDLAAIADEVNQRYFEGRLNIRITWGREQSPSVARRRGRPRTFKFGSYDHTLDLVRIHSRLDAPDVPRFYLNYLIYHELLHKTLGWKSGAASGRRSVHHAEFLEQERRHEHYDLASAWEQEFFNRWIAHPTPPAVPRSSSGAKRPGRGGPKRPPRKIATSPPAAADQERLPADSASAPPPPAPKCEQLDLFDL